MFIGQPVGLAPHHGHQPGPQHLHDAEGRQQVVQGVYLVLFSGDLNDHRLAADVDDVGPEEVNDLDDLASGHRRGLDLDQGQLPGHDGLAGNIRDLDNVDEFVQLLDHLAHGVIVAGHHKGHAGQSRLFAVAHGQADDVEPAAAEHAGHLGQDARFVFH